MNIRVRACVQSVHHQHAHDLRWLCYWLIVALIMTWSKSNQVCIKHFCRSLTSWIVSYTHCCITPN